MAIVHLTSNFAREFETRKIKTKSNEYAGVIQEKSPDAIVLKTSPQTTFRIAKADIISMETLDNLMMPQGLDKSLNKQEMSDLMAFLLGYNQDPNTDKAFLR